MFALCALTLRFLCNLTKTIDTLRKKAQQRLGEHRRAEGRDITNTRLRCERKTVIERLNELMTQYPEYILIWEAR